MSPASLAGKAIACAILAAAAIAAAIDSGHWLAWGALAAALFWNVAPP
jgi:hypothetical protein